MFDSMKYKISNFMLKWSIGKSFVALVRQRNNYLAILKQAFDEIRWKVRYINNAEQDRFLLGYRIRHRAHGLEQKMKNVFGQRFPEIYFQQMFDDLKTLLTEWENREYGECDTLSWSKKILKEYEGTVQSGSICRLVGMENSEVFHLNLLALLKTRRSIRHWKDEKLAKDVIAQLIDAARWAPSSCNRQTWHFIGIDNTDLIIQIAETVHGGGIFFAKAPLLLIILIDARPYHLPMEKYILYQDAAAAIQNILLMAHAMSLGACWAGYTSDSGIIYSESKVRNILDIPDCFKLAGIIAVGKPFERVCLISRRKIENIFSLNKF